MSLQDPCLIDHAGSCLVFGLHWQPVIGEQPARQARRMALAKRASHLVYGPVPGAAAGYGTLRTGPRRSLHAAAQVLALQHAADTVAFVLPVALRGIWMAAVHDGTVIVHTDRFFLRYEDALDAVADLRAAYPQLRLLDAQADPMALSLDQLVQWGSQHSRLQDLGRRRRLAWPGVLLAGLVVAVALNWPVQDPDAQSILSAREAHGHDAAWRQAQAQALSLQGGAAIPAASGLLHALYRLPLQVAGWQMRDTQCHVAQTAWRCLSRFRRQDPAATSAGYLSAAPTGWHSDFSSLDDVTASWHLAWQDDAPVRPVVQGRLAVVQDLFSALQAALPAFSRLHVGEPNPLAVPAPQDSQGQAIPRPAAVPIIHQRAWLAEGPLRSVSLLLPHADVMAWQRLVLDLQPNAKPGVRHSRLHVSLNGSLYETP